MSWPIIKGYLCTISQSGVTEHALEIKGWKNICVTLYMYIILFLKISTTDNGHIIDETANM